MWREQIKQNNIENQLKGEKYMICWGLFPLKEFKALQYLLFEV